MVGVTRNWIVRQLMMGEFRSYRDVCRKSVLVAAKVSLLAYCLNLSAHFLMHAAGLLPYSLGSALVIASVLTPPITFIISVVAYLAVGFAIHDLGVSRAELERLSRTDMLSGLANRRAFQDAFEQCGQDRAMAVFDIDRFKVINDTYGHTAGDKAIAEVAKTLADVFAPPYLCARIGGEEFAVLASGGSLAQFETLSEVARVRIAGLQIAAGTGSFQLTISGGVAFARSDQGFGETFSCADKALYAAKTAGRNRIVACPTCRPEASVPVPNAAAMAA